MLIIPAIDLREGRVVRLRQGDFERSRQFDHDPVELARHYLDAGARWLHLVDLDGARARRPLQTELLGRIAALGAAVQAGGGVRSRADVERLLAAGVARVVVGSVAIREPDTFAAWLDAFGADRLCLALDLLRDAQGRWLPAVDAWQAAGDADVAELLDMLAERGLRHVLSTDIAHDGMGEGPNLVLYRMLAGRWPGLAWIASGGVRHGADVAALRGTGVVACVAGTALLDGSLPLEEIAACSRTV
ncbi:MAG: 1-(5-phosphoribosyl)-5-((5-phosphoribosylamino)methylideneamino)imidazole-4-carboxamide isomerase [Rhodanobacter denitrificans]|uniref:1-(5-phosphoribosyl)-5-[(5-phosphoribosylamino)methylideneamino] imidazole-4-carboxamide isomerase n=1 Tax=Rhodanobacter denitrificans TaxID=666685 RepID=A0A2W5M6G4_9GAMM|nr:MAG: 1-(5-phosphoribosyl)-5-((5-phosphoribosylamino)methylideneamino)imidazole-4-carboxamide isomerase [Rhodanobacter denitrificans]